MPVSSALNGTADARGFLERACASANGSKITFASKSQAYAFKQRCFNVRATDKRQSRKIYQPEEPGHNASPYDGVTLYDGPDEKGHCPTCSQAFERWAVFAVKGNGMEQLCDVVDL